MKEYILDWKIWLVCLIVVLIIKYPIVDWIAW